MKIDLFLFTQGDTRVISHMSQTLGLMAELDVGTESWRWMGDTRFFVGFLWGRKCFPFGFMCGRLDPYYSFFQSSHSKIAQ